MIATARQVKLQYIFFDVMKFSSIQFIKIAFPLFENRLPITGTNMNRQILNK